MHRTAPRRIDVYDTTLRDGAQQKGLTLSVSDKLAVARLLDDLGVTYIEGGWPGAVPKDTEFFARAASGELELSTARLAAFGATRRADLAVEDDPQVEALVASAAPVVTLVAKAHRGHIERALRTSVEENLAMVRDTVSYLAAEGREVFVDAEHFFDGFAEDPDVATAVVTEALAAGAAGVVLCDTNGGMLPHRVRDTFDALHVRLRNAGVVVNRGTPETAGAPILGMHAHNDTGCAVANSVEAVRCGALQIQGCINGYGERTGNADLPTVVANLQLKEGRDVLPVDRLAELSRIAHAIGEITNVATDPRAPYAGANAFAHKAGLHASAIRVDPDLYQHIDPRLVGNNMSMIISDMAGRSSIELKGREMGLDLAHDREVLGQITARVKALEAEGYSFEAADASFELLVLAELGQLPEFFEEETWRTATSRLRDGSLETEATVKLIAGGQRVVAIAEGNGPVNALDLALREALRESYPEVESFRLDDFKVRILDETRGTGAVTRVLVQTSGMGLSFSTVGLGPNLIEASWEAISAAYTYGLLRGGVELRTD